MFVEEQQETYNWRAKEMLKYTTEYNLLDL